MVSWGSPPRLSREAGSKALCIMFIFLRMKTETYILKEDHLNKKLDTTKRMKNPQPFYYESYFDKEASEEREKKLKQFGSSYSGLVKRLRLK